MTPKAFLTERELSAYLTEIGAPMAVSTLQNKRVTGGGPPFVKLAGIRYRLADVERWIAKLPTLNSTCDGGQK